MVEKKLNIRNDSFINKNIFYLSLHQFIIKLGQIDCMLFCHIFFLNQFIGRFFSFGSFVHDVWHRPCEKECVAITNEKCFNNEKKNVLLRTECMKQSLLVFVYAPKERSYVLCTNFSVSKNSQRIEANKLFYYPIRIFFPPSVELIECLLRKR